MTREKRFMRKKPGDELSEEAIDWLVRLHSGHATASDRGSFVAWRARSAAHEAAACEAETLWREIGETSVAAAFRAEAMAAAPRGRTFRPRLAGPTRRALLAGAVAASAATVFVGSGALGPVSGLFSDYATGRGERRQVRLPDGSTAWLNTDSALSVAYDDAERRLSLNAGEALFDVAKDPARPFIVAARNGETRAIGTVFGVRRTAGEVGVIVSEGVVEVKLDTDGATPRRVAAGQRVRYGNARFIGAVETVDAGSALAWQRGRLIFNQRPLAAVVAELERYQLGRIVIADARLRDMPVTGVFDLDDPDGTLRTIEQTLPVKVLRLPLVTILLR